MKNEKFTLESGETIEIVRLSGREFKKFPKTKNAFEFLSCIDTGAKEPYVLVSLNNDWIGCIELFPEIMERI